MSGQQWDQIRRFLKFLIVNFFTKVGKLYCYFLSYFEKRFESIFDPIFQKRFIDDLYIIDDTYQKLNIIFLVFR